MKNDAQNMNDIPEYKKKLSKSPYGSNLFFSSTPTYFDLADIHERLTELEDRVLKTARKQTTTRSQQILMLKDLGLMEKINDLNISVKKKAYLLSILLNASADNIKDDLSNMYKPTYKHNNIENNEFLLKVYKEAGLKEQVEKTDTQLDKLRSKK